MDGSRALKAGANSSEFALFSLRFNSINFRLSGVGVTTEAEKVEDPNTGVADLAEADGADEPGIGTADRAEVDGVDEPGTGTGDGADKPDTGPAAEDPRKRPAER